MRLLAILLIAAILSMSPADAGILRGLKNIACKTIAIAAFPVVAPINYVGQKAALAYFYSKGDWRMVGYLIEGY